MKKTEISQLIIGLLFFCAVIGSSCVPGGTVTDPYYIAEELQRENIYYVPAAPHLPMVSEKNDINFNLMRASGKRFNGIEGQVAYMPWKKVALGASVSAGGHKAGTKKLDYNRFEIMSGFVQKIDRLWTFETYAGLGTGKISNLHYTGNSTIKLGHYFVQPGILVANEDKTIQFGFGSRFAGVNFDVRDTLFNTDRENFSGKQLLDLHEKPFRLMWEPAFVFRAGWTNIMFNLQYSHSSQVSGSTIHKSSDNFSFGVTVRGNAKTK